MSKCKCDTNKFFIVLEAPNAISCASILEALKGAIHTENELNPYDVLHESTVVSVESVAGEYPVMKRKRV